MANYVTFDQLKALFQEVGYKFKRVASAYTTKGNIAFANLPAASANTAGFVFNVTDEFTTTADFVEGAGKKYSAGTNVAIVDVTPMTYTVVKAAGDAEPLDSERNPKTLGWYEKDATQDVYFLTTDTTVDSSKAYYTAEAGTAAYKYDVIANFVDVDGIGARITSVGGSLADTFDNTAAYDAGDIVIYNDTLYKFKSAHAAGDWESSEVDTITVEDLIAAAEPEGLTTNQMNELLGLL